jgi:hypothetical protein
MGQGRVHALRIWEREADGPVGAALSSSSWVIASSGVSTVMVKLG